jgi:simple sugar transport system permease protein
MTVTMIKPVSDQPSDPSPATPSRLRTALPGIVRWTAAPVAALALFAILLVIQGTNPADAFSDMISSTFGRQQSIEQIFIRMTPLVLAALAVAVPARAGMTNVGGEGQIIVGAVAACGTYLALGDSMSGAIVMVMMIIASVIAGAAWAGIAGLMRLVTGVNEAISTLLLNFVALDLLLFLIYPPWRANPVGQPATRELSDAAKLPVISGTKVHVGIILAVVLVVVVHVVLRKTRWGFRIGVAGGNAEAARRAGFRVGALLLSALLIGGALAGLAGFVQFAGVEYKLRPSFGHQLGYTAFLACWLARHQPFPILVAAFVFAALGVAGDSLQIDSGVPSAAIYILTALILMAVLGFTTAKKKARI